MGEDNISYVAMYEAIIEAAAEVDNSPKDIVFNPPKGLEYECMCIGLAQGYEMDWVDHYARIMVNEFGEPEHFDDFKKRHPNFANDIANALVVFGPKWNEDGNNG